MRGAIREHRRIVNDVERRAHQGRSQGAVLVPHHRCYKTVSAARLLDPSEHAQWYLCIVFNERLDSGAHSPLGF